LRGVHSVFAQFVGEDSPVSRFRTSNTAVELLEGRTLFVGTEGNDVIRDAAGDGFSPDYSST